MLCSVGRKPIASLSFQGCVVEETFLQVGQHCDWQRGGGGGGGRRGRKRGWGRQTPEIYQLCDRRCDSAGAYSENPCQHHHSLCWLVFMSIQFSSRWYLCARKSPHALHPIFQKFPQRRLWNGSTVRLIDDGPLSSFQGRSSSASSFHACLLQMIYGVLALALALSPQVVSQASQYFRSSEKQDG